MVTILLVGAAGVLVGWVVGILSDATDCTSHDLKSYRPSEEDLIRWDEHTSGGRRG